MVRYTEEDRTINIPEKFYPKLVEAWVCSTHESNEPINIKDWILLVLASVTSRILAQEQAKLVRDSLNGGNGKARDDGTTQQTEG